MLKVMISGPSEASIGWGQGEGHGEGEVPGSLRHNSRVSAGKSYLKKQL